MTAKRKIWSWTAFMAGWRLVRDLDARYVVTIRGDRYPDISGKTYSRKEVRVLKSKAWYVGVKLDVRRVED